MKFTPIKLPDELQARIFWSQAMNLAVESIGVMEELDSGWREEIVKRQEYFFNALMLPYKPLLKAREEKEKLFNTKVRTKEIYEQIKGGEINYEENND